MKKLVITALLSMWASALFSADTIKLKPNTNLVINARTDATYTLRSTTSTNPGDVASPVRIYAPVQSSYPNQTDYFLYTHSNSPYNYLFNTTNTAHVISLPLYLNSVGGPKYIKMMVREGTGTTWRVFNDDQTQYNNEVSTEIQYEFSPTTMCQGLTSGSVADCNNLAPTVTGLGQKRQFMLYIFFTSNASIGLGNGSFTPTSFPDGMYVELNLSNQISPNIVTTITKVRQGDRRAFLEYGSNQAFVDAKYVMAFERATPSTTSDLIGSAIGKINAREYDYQQNSELAVTDLVNNQTYNFSVFFADNYNFTTKLSPSADASPKEIEQLLKEHNCFLLTAGFGEQHFIINYFRDFRDSVLAKSYLGRAFISVYYELAPKYALIIYKHEALRAMIRGIAYVVYFIMTHLFVVLMTSITGVILIYLYKNKEKIKV